MKAIYKYPGRQAEVIDIENNTDAIVRAVCGFFALLPLQKDSDCYIAFDALLNDGVWEGKEGLFNVFFHCRPIFGRILLVGWNNEKFYDLPDLEHWLACLNKMSTSI